MRYPNKEQAIYGYIFNHLEEVRRKPTPPLS